MKTLRHLCLSALFALTPLCAFATANDLSIAQKNSGDTAWITRIFQPLGGTPVTSVGAFRTALGTAFNQIIAKSADFNVLASQNGALFNVTTGNSNVTATLPTGAAGLFFILRKADSGTGGVLSSPSVNGLFVSGHMTLLTWDINTSAWIGRAWFGSENVNGAITISAGGTNQNITLTPSGTGVFSSGNVSFNNLSVSTPVSVANGGTGSNTASAARAALNAVSVVYEFTFSTAPAGATGGSGSWTWTIPSWGNSIQVNLYGAGAGGGAGGRFASGLLIRGGGGGSGGNRWNQLGPNISVSTLPSSTLTLSVPDGGAGGIAQVTNSTAGADGLAPSGPTTVTSGSIVFASAFGGLPGTGGAVGSGGVGGAAILTTSGGLIFGSSNTGSAGTNGATVQNGTDSTASNMSAVNGTSGYGGAGGGGITALVAQGIGGVGTAVYLDTALTILLQAGGVAGNNSNGGDSVVFFIGRIVNGTGGGGANVSGAGFRGGNGLFGTGGGGGGASLNGSNSGAGGKGGGGYVRITVYP